MFITLWFKIPSFITTLGSMSFWEAAVLFVHGASEQTFTPAGAYRTLTNGSWGVLPACVLLLASAPGYYLTAFVGALIIIVAAVIYQNLQARRA